MGKVKPVINASAFMTLEDGTVVPFYTICDLGLPTQKINYSVDDAVRQRWNDDMMRNTSAFLSQYYNEKNPIK